MAAITWFLHDTAVDSWARLSETADTAATTPSGWTVSTGTTNHSELNTGTERAASTFTGTTVPDGTLDTSLFDAFRTENSYNGTFASANWVFHGVVRAVTNGGAHDGRCRFRLIKADANGANATEITAAQQQGSQVTDVSTTADFDSTLTFNPGSFTVTNQYIFFQIAWERIGAGGMTNSDILFRTGSDASTGTRITSSDFTVAATPTRGRISWAELEAPFVATRGRVSWAEQEVPFQATRGRVSWAELETPIAPTRGRISWAELEAPFAPTRGLISWAEQQVPDLGPTPTRGLVSWAELETPLAPTRGLISWAELEAPSVPTRGQVSWAEFEVLAAATRGRISWAEFQTPALGEQVSFSSVDHLNRLNRLNRLSRL